MTTVAEKATAVELVTRETAVGARVVALAPAGVEMAEARAAAVEGRAAPAEAMVGAVMVVELVAVETAEAAAMVAVESASKIADCPVMVGRSTMATTRRSPFSRA
jgi:hypothetical protein